MTDRSDAIISYEGRPTSTVEEIMKQVVATGTQGNCNDHNVDIVLWLYDSEDLREELLSD